LNIEYGYKRQRFETEDDALREWLKDDASMRKYYPIIKYRDGEAVSSFDPKITTEPAGIKLDTRGMYGNIASARRIETIDGVNILIQ